MGIGLAAGPVQARLVGLTEEARRALPGGGLVIPNFPFRVGRERRQSAGRDGIEADGGERSGGSGDSNNDLFIRESGREVFLSREHFLIDRGSTLGPLVNGTLVGGGGEFGGAPLTDGAVIVPGGNKSPYRFRFEVGKVGEPE